MKCIHCTKDIPEGSIYCNHCGKQQVFKYDQLHQNRIRPYLRTLNHRDALLLVNLIFFLVLFLASFSSLGKVPLTHLVNDYPEQIEIKYNITDLLAATSFVFQDATSQDIHFKVDAHANQFNLAEPGYLEQGYGHFETIDFYLRNQINTHMNLMNPLIVYQSSEYRNVNSIPLLLLFISTAFMLVYIGYLIVVMFQLFQSWTKEDDLNLTQKLLNVVILSLVGMILLSVFGYVSGYTLSGYPKTMFWFAFIGYLTSLVFQWARSTKPFIMGYVVKKVMIFILLMLSLNSLFAVRLNTHYELHILFGSTMVKDEEPLLTYLPRLVQFYHEETPPDTQLMIHTIIDTLTNQVHFGQRELHVRQLINSYDLMLSTRVIDHHELLNTIMLFISVIQLILLMMLFSMIHHFIRSLHHEDRGRPEGSSVTGAFLFLSVVMLSGLIYVKFSMDEVYRSLDQPVFLSISFASFTLIVWMIILLNQNKMIQKLNL